MCALVTGVQTCALPICRIGSGVGSARRGVHRAVSSAFDGRRGVFGGRGRVVGSLFAASGEAERSGKDERQSDRLIHVGIPLLMELMDQIGRASCRQRMGKTEQNTVVAVYLTKTKKKHQ